MSDIQFNEPNYGSQTRFQKRTSWPTKLLVKLGVSKEQAPMVMVGITIVAVLVTLVVGFGGSNQNLGSIDEEYTLPETQ